MQRLILVAIAFACAGCGSPTAEDWIRQLKDPDVLRRREAIRELKAQGDSSGTVVTALAERLHDENAFVRRDAAMALGSLGAEARSARPKLREALKDKDARVRGATLNALAKIEPKKKENNKN